MTFGIGRGVAVDSSGNVQTNVYVEVRRMAPGYPLAVPIYEDADGDVTLSNPFLSASGEFEFYAVGGLYRVYVYKTGYEKTWDNVPVGTAQAADVDAYASAGFTWAPESATATPPSNGCIRFNNADISLATHVYIDQDTLGGSDATNWLNDIDAGDWLLASTGVGIEVGWPVTSVVDAGAYFNITIDQTQYAGPAGPLSFGDSGFVTISRERLGAPGADGVDGDDGLDGADGANGYTPGYRFTFSTTTADADPGNGALRFNHATFGSITYLYVDNQDAAAVSVTNWLDGLDDVANANARAYIRLQKADDPTVYAEFAVTGAVVDGTGYRKVPVSPIAGAVPSNGVTLAVTAAKSGADGAGSTPGAASTTEVLTGSDASKMVTPDALAALWEKGGDVASSGTVSFGEGGYFHVTGTTTITDIDFATPKDGRWAWVIFDGALTLTHNSTTLKLPGNTNITTAAGDRALFVQDNSDNVICLAYIPATGYQPLDSDLSTLASLTATTDNFIQSKSSAWASRTPTQVTADLIAVVGDSGSGGTKGLVPAPSAGDAAAGKYLKADGTWTAPTAAGITTDSQQPTSDTDNVTSSGFSGCKVVDICFAFTITDGTSRVMSIQGRVSGGTWRTIVSFSTVADPTSAIGGWCRIYNFNVATEKVCSYDTYTNTAVLDDSSASNNVTTAAASGVGYVAQNEIWDEVRIVSNAGTPIEGSTADQRGRWYVAGYA